MEYLNKITFECFSATKTLSMPNTRNSDKKGKSSKSEKNSVSNKASCQNKMDNFLTKASMDTDTVSRATVEKTTASTVSVDTTVQTLKFPSQTSPPSRAEIEVSTAIGEATTVSSESTNNGDSTVQAIESPSQASTDPDKINVEVTDMASVQTVLGQILKAVKPISNMSCQINNLVSDVRKFEKSLSEQSNRMDNLETRVGFNDQGIKDLDEKVENIVKNQATKDHLTAMELAFAKDNAGLRKHISKLEEYSRRNNLIFHGIHEKDNEQCEDEIKSFLVDKLDIVDAHTRIIINKAHRIGPKKAGPPRPIIVQFIYSAQVSEVFSKKMSLKEYISDTSSQKQKKSAFFITRDFPDDIVRTRKQLQQVLKIAKKIDPTSHLSKDKLIFNKKAHSLADCYKSEVLKVEQIGSLHHIDSVLFHGRFCPLSNFFPSKLLLGEKYFQSVEQYFQYQKARFCGDWSVAYQIMHATDPVEMKKLGDSLGNDCWPKDIQIKEMKTALIAKFTQNQHPAKFLRDTGNKTIIECNKFDSFWGNGRSLYDKRAVKGTGENRLGAILEDVRACLY